MKFEKLKQGYSTIALLVFNTLLIFMALNFGIWVYGRVIDKDVMLGIAQPNPADLHIPARRLAQIKNIDFDILRQLYPGQSDTEIIQLQLEGWGGLKYVCDDDAIFRIAPYPGNYYTIGEAGFREIESQGAWPPEPDAYNIFVFGGSTSFGGAENNNQAISSWLQAELQETLGIEAIKVYNFGTPLYTSLQERWRFEGLVQDGFVPDLAIFIDGLNDFSFYNTQIGTDGDAQCSEPLTTSARIVNTFSCGYDEMCLPLQKLVTVLDTRNRPSYREQLQEITGIVFEPEVPVDDMDANTRVIERWLENKGEIEKVAQQHDTQLLFIMQPISAYAYDLQYHLLVDDPDAFVSSSRAAYGYAIWEEMAADTSADWVDNVLNLIRLSEDNEEPLYVTKVHYMGSFSHEIAQAIADSVVERGLIMP